MSEQMQAPAILPDVTELPKPMPANEPAANVAPKTITYKSKEWKPEALPTLPQALQPMQTMMKPMQPMKSIQPMQPMQQLQPMQAPMQTAPQAFAQPQMQMPMPAPKPCGCGGHQAAPQLPAVDVNGILQMLSPWVHYGMQEACRYGVHHALTEVALISYLMGRGLDPQTAHAIVESFEMNETFPRRY